MFGFLLEAIGVVGANLGGEGTHYNLSLFNEMENCIIFCYVFS